MASQPPGWFPDPYGRGGLRYWDGSQWTAHQAATPPAPPPGRRGGWRLIVAIIVAIVAIPVIVVFVAGGLTNSKSSGAGSGVSKGVKDLPHNTKITSCGKDRLGRVDVQGVVTNDTSTRSDFQIDLVITGASGKTFPGPSTTATVTNIDPGQTISWNGVSLLSWRQGLVCKVTAVRRTDSSR